MFDKFKAAHGGLGPIQALNSAVTGGEGVAGRLGVKRARSLLNSIIDQQQGDEELAGSLAPVWDNLKRTRMTEADLEKSAGLLVQRGADIKQAGKSFADFGELQSRYRSAAGDSPDNLAILDSLDTQAKIAHDMVTSANPQIAQQGQALFGNVFTAQREYATKNEEQRILKDAQNDAGIRAMGEQRWTRYQATRDDLGKESAPFLVQRQALGTAKALLGSNSEASDYGLLYSWNKMLDPNSSVREGEFANAQNLAGVPDIVVTALNNLRGGQRLTPEKRADIYKQMSDIFKQGVNEQTERNGRYANQARAFDVPDDAISAMMIPVQSPGGDPQFSTATPPPTNDQNPQTDSTARMVGESVGQGVKTAAGGAIDAVTGLVVPAIKGIDQALGESIGLYRKPAIAPRNGYPRAGTIQRNTDEFR